MVKYFSLRAQEAEKTTKTKWILNCGTPCTCFRAFIFNTNIFIIIVISKIIRFPFTSIRTAFGFRMQILKHYNLYLYIRGVIPRSSIWLLWSLLTSLLGLFQVQLSSSFIMLESGLAAANWLWHLAIYGTGLVIWPLRLRYCLIIPLFWLVLFWAFITLSSIMIPSYDTIAQWRNLGAHDSMGHCRSHWGHCRSL